MTLTNQGLAATALIGALLLPAIGQAQGQPQGTPRPEGPSIGVFSFHSGSKGSCPGLDWNVSRDGDRLAGFITWNNGKSVAQVKGNVAHGDFTLNVKEVGGSRTAKITGTISGGTMMVARISGVPRCEGKTINVPWYSGADGDD